MTTGFCKFTLILLLAVMISLGGAAAAAEAKEEPQVTVYFPNWNVYSDSRNQVKICHGTGWTASTTLSGKWLLGTAALRSFPPIPGRIRIRIIPLLILSSTRNVRKNIPM